jgi:hypothetical protein
MKVFRVKKIKISLISILLFASIACQFGGNISSGQEGGAPPAETQPEITQEPPPQETQPPVEPQPTEPLPEEPQPTLPQQPPPETQPPDSGQNNLIAFLQQNAVPILIGLGILLLGIALIVAIIARPRPSAPVPPPSAALGEQPQAQPEPAFIPAPSPEPTPPLPQPSVYAHLQNANPEVTALYQRFAEMIENQGPVSIIPTKTRIDFQVRIIFASVQLYLDSLQINLLLSDKVEDIRIQRVDEFGDGKYLHYFVIRSLDDYDVQFSTWLQEAYNLGAQG